jgi:hypothetical protein
MIADPERVTSYIGRYGNAFETVEGANIASLLLTSLNAISCDRMREGILHALLGPEDPDFCTELCSEEPVDASPSDALGCERPHASPPATPVHEKKSTWRIQSKKSKLVRFKSSPCSFTVNKTAVSVKVGVTTSPITTPSHRPAPVQLQRRMLFQPSATVRKGKFRIGTVSVRQASSKHQSIDSGVYKVEI